MDRKILYFINPVSGPRRKGSPEKLIAEASKERGLQFEFALTNPAGSYPTLAEKLIGEHFTDVVVCGGDGSISQVVGSVLGLDINIGIVPMGSGNGLALAAKIPKQLKKSLEVIFDAKASYIDAFFINDKFSCMLCGVGLDAKVAHDFAAKSNRGLETYIRETIKNFVTASPYPFDITVKGKTFSTEAFFISIANSNQFGNNFKIAPKAILDDGKLDIIVVKKMRKWMLIWSILKHLISGQVINGEANFHNSDLVYIQSDKLLIHNHSMAPLHIDGEPVETFKQLDIRIIPAAFRLIRP